MLQNRNIFPNTTACDNEPIHIPGAVQPFGFLLVFDPATLAVVQVSANVPAFIGGDLPKVGTPLSEIIGLPATQTVAALLGSACSEIRVAVSVSVNSTAFDGAVHRWAGVAILELEPAGSADSDGDWQSVLGSVVQRLQHANSLQSLYEEAVGGLRELTGYDRVMLYRFDEDEHGHVVCDAVATDLASFTGQHFPASDIPRQARDLYRRNWLRIIPDASYQPVPLVPQVRPDTGLPLDLSFSILRSVSPVHREYMKNFGAAASLSVPCSPTASFGR